MATQSLQLNIPNQRKAPLLRVFLVTVLCSVSFLLGSNISSSDFNSHKAQYHVPNDQQPCPKVNTSAPQIDQDSSVHLHFLPNHSLPLAQELSQSLQPFAYCSKRFSNYCPCEDPVRQKSFYNATTRFHNERHCPASSERVKCLTPAPSGYRTPFPWPKGRDYAWFKNVPFPQLVEFKKSQNWVRLEGELFVFPGGGTSFRQGAKGYVDEILKSAVPLKSGKIRTALDVGCGVASFGAALLENNILTMSIAPRDRHESQVQFALERGLPAMLGVLSVHRLPFPSRSFDMAHCSRCLVPWTANDGLYLIEIDRVLRPGGYWVLSGPPISWRTSYKGWERNAQDLENEQIMLEDVARKLCWKKISEKGPIAVWQKPTNHIHCKEKLKTWKYLKLCTSSDVDAGWYSRMKPCICPLPDVRDIHDVAGGATEKWPKRLNAAPPRIKSKSIPGVTVADFNEDNKMWQRRVSYYSAVLKSLPGVKYRNVMDMNAGFGGFAAAMAKYPLWVMNVVPFDTQNNTLGIIYDRGLIGTYMNWCEAFSTYPRTYDLIHAHDVFSMYKNKCDIADILLEMQRILRPHGAVIIRDYVDILVQVKDIIDRMRWNSKLLHSEKGPFHPEKVLLIDNSE